MKRADQDHEADMQVIQGAVTHHLHCPAKQVLVFVSVGGIVEENVPSSHPWIIVGYSLPVGCQERNSVVSVLRS